MAQSECETLFGSSLPVTYMDSSGVYHSTTASVLPSAYQLQLANQYTDTTGYMISGRDFLCYQFQATDLNAAPRQITVDISCQYSIFDTEFIYTAAAMPCSTTTNLSAYDSPTWNWIFAGNTLQFHSVDISNNNILPQVYFSDWCDFVMCYMDSQATTSGYSLRLTFDHASYSSGTYVRFYIGLPYVSSGASGNNGTSGLTTSGSETTTTAINVNVDVDLSQTNGILGSISNGISNIVSGIISGIQSFFIPSHEDFQNFRSSLESSLTQHFGPLFTSRQLITSAFQNLDDLALNDSFVVPQIDVPIKVSSDGTVLQTQSFFGNTVDLRPQYAKLHVLYDSLEILVNMIMTLWTINTLRNMLNNYILNWHDYQEYDPEGVFD